MTPEVRRQRPLAQSYLKTQAPYPPGGRSGLPKDLFSSPGCDRVGQDPKQHLFSQWAASQESSLVAQRVMRLPAMLETQVRSLGQEDLLEKTWQPTPVPLPGKSHGRRRLRSMGSQSRIRLSDFTFTSQHLRNPH